MYLSSEWIFKVGNFVPLHCHRGWQLVWGWNCVILVTSCNEGTARNQQSGIWAPLPNICCKIRENVEMWVRNQTPGLSWQESQPPVNLLKMLSEMLHTENCTLSNFFASNHDKNLVEHCVFGEWLMKMAIVWKLKIQRF